MCFTLSIYLHLSTVHFFSSYLSLSISHTLHTYIHLEARVQPSGAINEVSGHDERHHNTNVQVEGLVDHEVPFPYQLSCNVCICERDLLHQIPFPLIRWYMCFVCERERAVAFGTILLSTIMCRRCVCVCDRVVASDTIPPCQILYFLCVWERAVAFGIILLSTVMCHLCVCDRVVASDTIPSYQMVHVVCVWERELLHSYDSPVIYHMSFVCGLCVWESCSIKHHSPISCHISYVTCVFICCLRAVCVCKRELLHQATSTCQLSCIKCRLCVWDRAISMCASVVALYGAWQCTNSWEGVSTINSPMSFVCVQVCLSH